MIVLFIKAFVLVVFKNTQKLQFFTYLIIKRTGRYNFFTYKKTVSEKKIYFLIKKTTHKFINQ